MKFVLTDASVTVNSVDLSDHCSKVTIQAQSNPIDVSAPLASRVQEMAVGAISASITLTVFQDFNPGSVDATLWPLFLSGAPFPVIVKRSSAGVSSTNPAWGMNGVLTAYTPIDGQVGAAAVLDVPIVCADASGITRGTA